MSSILDSWINQYDSASTRNLYKWGFNLFLEFLGNDYTVERVVEERKKDTEFRFEQKTVDFYQWLKNYVTKSQSKQITKAIGKTGTTFTTKMRFPGGKKLADNARKNATTAVRSFFAFNRMDLKFTVQQKGILGKKSKPKENDYLLSLIEIEAMGKTANPQERFILFAGKDLGLRAIDFRNIPQGYYVKAIKSWRDGEASPTFLGKFYTQKEGADAYSFLTEDGLDAAELWLKILENKGHRNDEKPMLRIAEKELTENLRRLAEKAGINPYGQRIRFHCLRKFLIDRLSLKMSESKWKQIVGKTITEGAYVSSLELKQAYAEVLDHIQIQKLGVNEEIMRLLRVPEVVNWLKRKMREEGIEPI